MLFSQLALLFVAGIATLGVALPRPQDDTSEGGAQAFGSNIGSPAVVNPVIPAASGGANDLNGTNTVALNNNGIENTGNSGANGAVAATATVTTTVTVTAPAAACTAPPPPAAAATPANDGGFLEGVGQALVSGGAALVGKLLGKRSV